MWIPGYGMKDFDQYEDEMIEQRNASLMRKVDRLHDDFTEEVLTFLVGAGFTPEQASELFTKTTHHNLAEKILFAARKRGIPLR